MFLTDGYEAPVGDTARFPRDLAPDPWHVSLAYAIWYVLLDVQASIHTGSDLSMEPGGGYGKPVYAVANGVIRYLKDVTGSSWRNLLVIEHQDPDGLVRCSRYGHLLAFAPGLAVGDWVHRGQLVGWVGNADGLFYAHLHHDIAKGTLLVKNPTNWPGDNLSYVYANYDNPEVVIREDYPMSVDPISQAIGLFEQGITILKTQQPPPPPPPYPDPDPNSIVVVVKNNGTNIRTSAAIGDNIKDVVNAGTELHVLNANTTSGGHTWYRISGGQYDGCFIAQDVVAPKA